MKTILLMSCALCAGMNGYGNGMGIQEISLENNDVSKRKIQDGRIVTNSSSPKRIKKGDSPDCVTDEPHQEELDVVSDEKDSLEEIKEANRSESEEGLISRDSGNPSNQPPATKTHASDPVIEKLKEGTQGSPDCITAEPSQEEFSVALNPAWWEEEEAYYLLLDTIDEEVGNLLGPKVSPTEESSKRSIQNIIKTNLKQDALAYHCIESYLLDKLGSEKYATRAAADKILKVLNDMSPDELFQDNCEEE